MIIIDESKLSNGMIEEIGERCLGIKYNHNEYQWETYLEHLDNIVNQLSYNYDFDKALNDVLKEIDDIQKKLKGVKE